MALKKTYTTPEGIVLTDAYIRVFAVDVGPKLHEDVGGGNTGLAKVGVHVAADKPMVAFMTTSFKYDPAGKGVFAQAYDFLKTLPQFDGASDC